MRAYLAAAVALAVGATVSSGCRRGDSDGSGTRAAPETSASSSANADSGVGAYREAEAAYRTLVLEGVSPRDPRFDAVRTRLREVPAESKAHGQAQDLLRRLDALAGVPERPLAVPRLADEESPCEPLAQALGQATEAAERERILNALRDCRAKEERHKAHSHPPGEGVHEGHGH